MWGFAAAWGETTKIPLFKEGKHWGLKQGDTSLCCTSTKLRLGRCFRSNPCFFITSVLHQQPPVKQRIWKENMMTEAGLISLVNFDRISMSCHAQRHCFPLFFPLKLYFILFLTHCHSFTPKKWDTHVWQQVLDLSSKGRITSKERRRKREVRFHLLCCHRQRAPNTLTEPLW